jgi:hypothetical protein
MKKVDGERKKENQQGGKHEKEEEHDLCVM